MHGSKVAMNEQKLEITKVTNGWVINIFGDTQIRIITRIAKDKKELLSIVEEWVDRIKVKESGPSVTRKTR